VPVPGLVWARASALAWVRALARASAWASAWVSARAGVPFSLPALAPARCSPCRCWVSRPGSTSPLVARRASPAGHRPGSCSRHPPARRRGRAGPGPRTKSGVVFGSLGVLTPGDQANFLDAGVTQQVETFTQILQRRAGIRQQTHRFLLFGGFRLLTD